MLNRTLSIVIPILALASCNTEGLSLLGLGTKDIPKADTETVPKTPPDNTSTNTPVSDAVFVPCADLPWTGARSKASAENTTAEGEVLTETAQTEEETAGGAQEAEPFPLGPFDDLPTLPFDFGQQVGSGKPARQDQVGGIAVVSTSNGAGGCTGTLIGDEWVLTAAHCAYDKTTYNSVDGHKVSFGKLKFEHSVWPHTGTAYCHADFRFPYNDIALIKLDKPASSSIPRERLPKAGATTPANEATLDLFGYGFTSSTQVEAETKDRYDAPVQRLLTTGPVVVKSGSSGIEKTFAAPTSSKTGPTALCSGDSGGPVFQAATGPDQPRVVVGVNSARAWASNAPADGTAERSCGGSGVISRFVDVSRYTSWIETVMNSAP